MAWFTPRSPVTAVEQAWIEDSIAWLAGEFGPAVVHRPVVEPTPACFPVGGFAGRANVEAVLYLVADAMAVPRERLALEYVAGRPDRLLRWQHAYSGPAGHYHEQDGTAVITVYGGQISTPGQLVATLAHELGHVRLLGENRIAWDRPDGEPLTDLLTVVFGYGIFSANAAFDFSADAGGWRSRRLGYMTEQMFGYALARYSLLRGESAPAWATHLDTNPRGYMRQAMRYLRAA
jgi:hypothetical protein